MDLNTVVVEEQGSRIRLYLAVLSVNLLYISCGAVTGWTSPTLPILMQLLTSAQVSLVGSLYSLGAAFGPISSAICLDTIGRKGTLYVLAICYLISWIMLAISKNVYVLYLGRIIGGIGVGGTFSSASLFIAEIADTKSRGAVGSLNMASVALGLLIEYCIGPWSSYLILIIVSAIPGILFLITFFFIPESPYYLMIKDRKEEAVESLRWFRGNVRPETVQKELSTIQESIDMRREHQGGVKALFRRGPFKALMIGIYLLILQQGSGNNAILTFAQLIFELGHVAISGSICAIIGGATVFLASILTPFIVRRFSMKKAFLISTFGVGITLGILALYFYLQSNGYDVSKISFLPILVYILYNVLLCWGCGPLPWAIVAELFPLEVKGLATCICGVISSLAGFAVIEISGILIPHEGLAIVFAGFCLFVILATAGSVFVIPDTNGLTLQEIHNFLATGKRPSKSEDKS